MDEKVINALKQENLSEKLTSLFNHAKGLAKMSRTAMGEHHAEWDRNSDIYKATRVPDKDDKTAANKGAPVKMTVPLTYSQVETFRTFALGQFFQREMFYELEATGVEDYEGSQLAQAVLDHDLQHNMFFSTVYQLLGDIALYRIGILESSWTTEVGRQLVNQPVPGMTAGGAQITENTDNWVWEDVTEFKGNKVTLVSPYRFLPDTRLPITKFQDGEFCGHEEEFSYNRLRALERAGEVAGIDHLKSITRAALDERGTTRFTGLSDETVLQTPAAQTKSPNLVTRMQIEIIPSEYEISEGVFLGEENYPVKYLLWYANDDRIIRLEPLNYPHGKFTYDVAQFSPDQHSLLNVSIADVLGKLQDVVDWFINSHITNVRKVIQNRIIVDPNAVHMEDLVNHRPVIRLKAGYTNTGVDRWIKQLDVNDVTGRHMQDLQVMIQLMQLTTSISDNMLGQYAPGRRSSREAGNVAQSAGARLSMHNRLIWEQCLAPLGKKMLQNHQMGLDEPMAVKVNGDFTTRQAYNGFVKVDRTMIAGMFDFKIFDGTVASERQKRGEVLQAVLLEALKAGPDGFQFIVNILGFDPRKIMRDVLIDYGIKHPDRFKLDQVRQQELMTLYQNGGLLTDPTGGAQAVAPTAAAGPVPVAPTGIGAPAPAQGQPGVSGIAAFG